MNRKKQPSCCRRFREERIRPLSEADVLKPYEVACALSKTAKPPVHGLQSMNSFAWYWGLLESYGVMCFSSYVAIGVLPSPKSTPFNRLSYH